MSEYDKIREICEIEKSIPLLMNHMMDLRGRLDTVRGIASDLQKAYDFISQNVLPERMEEEEISTLTVKGVGRLQIKSDIRCSVLSANRTKLHEWLESNGHGSLISESVNPSTLKAFVKDLMKNGHDIPDDIIKIDPYSQASITRV